MNDPDADEPDADEPDADEPRIHVETAGLAAGSGEMSDSEPDSEPDSERDSELTEFVLGRDYEVEDGLVVFTASYLLAKGKCCRLGCRNCPWGFSGKASSRGRGSRSPRSE